MPSHQIQCSVFIATSLDGFIAKSDGNIDWLHQGEQIEDEDFGYQAFFDSTDAMIMGRNTFEIVAKFAPWPYEGKRVIVLSNSLASPPDPFTEIIEIATGPLPALLTKLNKEGVKRVYIDGGKTIQSFLKEGLISDLTITRIPILLGEGKSLFGKTNGDILLKHIDTKAYPNGFVSSRYEISHGSANPN